MTIRKSLSHRNVGLFLIMAVFSAHSAFSEGLTPDQVAKVKEKMAELRLKMDDRLKQRNLNAGDIFLQASQSPKAALEFYLESYKIVKYDRENRKETEFRVWKEANEGRLSNDSFLESLQIQLRYLSVSCKAAEVEEFNQIFAPLMEYVDGLSRLEEMPDQSLFRSVASTIFAERYYLERLLSSNDEWEPTPFNIAGIYEKAILPYLRKEKPEALATAWDRRIEQQSRMVTFIDEQNKKQLRGLEREKEIREKDRQDNRGGILKDHDPEKFAFQTLPKLKWAKLVDLFQYVDEVNGAKALLDFVDQNLQHPLAEDWLKQLEGLLGETESALETADEPTATAPVEGEAGFD